MAIGAKKPEVDWFYEDLQQLLEHLPPHHQKKKNVLFIIGDWKTEVGSQELPRVTGKVGLEYKLKQGKG